MTEKKKKYIWLIAGGVQQVPMMKEIKARGYGLFLTDGNPNCIGKDYADQFVHMDTYNVYGHLDLASAMKEKPIAVLAVAADVGPTVSAVADELDLFAVDYEVARRTRNKLEMRKAISADSPAYLEMSTTELMGHTTWKTHATRRANISNVYPCVAKPLERAGSKGVHLVENPHQWSRIIKNVRIADGKMNRTFIVEELLQPSEIGFGDGKIYKSSVATDNFVYKGKVYFANAVQRLFDKDIFGLELGHLNPFELDDQMKDMIRYTAKALGVDWGPLKVDFIQDTRYGWVIEECATRLSGGFDHMYACPLATGKDITGAMLDMAITGKLNTDKLESKGRQTSVFTYSPILEPGGFTKIILPEKAYLKEKFIVATDTILPLKDCTQRALFYMTTGTAKQQAYERGKTVEKGIEIEYV